MFVFHIVDICITLGSEMWKGSLYWMSWILYIAQLYIYMQFSLIRQMFNADKEINLVAWEQRSFPVYLEATILRPCIPPCT